MFVSVMQERIQKFGSFLSGMVIPNIGAFIAWGLITTLFIPTGWTPNEELAKLVGPMILYLLPLLIGYTGGKLVGGPRGAILGVIATMGVVVGAKMPMFLGAMVMGPLGGFIIKKFDKAIDGKIPAGFEMLVNNFSAGIIGAVMAVLAYMGIGPIMQSLNLILKSGVESIVNAGMLPLAAIFIEPAKILFLNNAIDHGVLGPLGVEQAKEVGKSILFLLVTNPGPGLGVLLAYWSFAKGASKESAPGAIIIHFLGGIHELYFPYVLMNPILLLAVIVGGASGILTFTLFGVGLVATPSPGSIFALMAMTPKGGHLGVLAGVVVSTAVSFLISTYFVKRAAVQSNDSELESAKAKMQAFKHVKLHKGISKIIFACDAGMGSSAMGAKMLERNLKNAGFDLQVVNYPVDQIPNDAQIVVTHESLTSRAKNVVPNAQHISVKDFLDSSIANGLVEMLKQTGAEISSEGPEIAAVVAPSAFTIDAKILVKNNIKLGLKSVDKYEAIKMAGRLLVQSGYVENEYVDAMLQRETELTTYIGQGIAIPHGVNAAKEKVKKSGIVVLQFPDGIDFGEGIAYIVVGIAGKGDEHLDILSNLVGAIVDDNGEKLEQLKITKNVDYMYNVIAHHV